VVHWDDHGFSCVPINNSFHSDFFPEDRHDTILPFDMKSKKKGREINFHDPNKKAVGFGSAHGFVCFICFL